MYGQKCDDTYSYFMITIIYFCLCLQNAMQIEMNMSKKIIFSI